MLLTTLPWPIVTTAPLPSASMTLEFVTLSSMTRLPLEVASSVPELTTARPVLTVSVPPALLALTVPRLTSVRWPSPAPIAPAPEMVLLTLTSVAPLLTASMKAWEPSKLTVPPPCRVALDEPTRSTPEARTTGSTWMAPPLLMVPLIVSVALFSISTSEPAAIVPPLNTLPAPLKSISPPAEVFRVPP